VTVVCSDEQAAGRVHGMALLTFIASHRSMHACVLVDSWTSFQPKSTAISIL
jgi:hypothetical protein